MVTLRSSASLEMAAVKEAVVRGMVDALQRADPTAISALLADDVVYHFPGRSEVAGTYRSRAEVMGLFGTFSRLLGAPPRLSNHDVVASEAHVVELSTHAAEREGRPHEWHAVRIYHIGEDDRITEIWLMIEDVHAFDAWLGSRG
jgi:ketosteroid isomerase-like protein